MRRLLRRFLVVTSVDLRLMDWLLREHFGIYGFRVDNLHLDDISTSQRSALTIKELQCELMDLVAWDSARNHLDHDFLSETLDLFIFLPLGLNQDVLKDSVTVSHVAPESERVKLRPSQALGGIVLDCEGLARFYFVSWRSLLLLSWIRHNFLGLFLLFLWFVCSWFLRRC